ncbi:unnamed protein product [Fraxinus pennsylvanica]|uniref:BZIP domain-containing protein n=1 Tax=Fraxinus pennsylvanica TaxID=56036 RepID=A0AAD1Z143_9LAMI|nr:unnamed protein product [Fraxinus pennsylvanica]
MSTSPLMGNLSDTQMPGRERVAPNDATERTIERRHKKMIKNRESASRSRAKKQAYTYEMENEVSCLEVENGRLRRQKLQNPITISITTVTSASLPLRHNQLKQQPAYSSVNSHYVIPDSAAIPTTKQIHIPVIKAETRPLSHTQIAT